MHYLVKFSLVPLSSFLH